jgi:beta-lactamase superfamily II metal-dependent hydrolase
MSITSLPDPGFVFWPVGCGDSTTVAIDQDTVVQVDLHHVEASEAEDDVRTPVIDRLVKLLPERGGRPYLAAFGATHLDKDHVQGFAELLETVTIGDLWFTPRILWEQQEDPETVLCEDAQGFVDEAERRINLMKAQGTVGSGDRIRIIGYHDVLAAHKDIYKDLPEGSVTAPGNSFTHVDGEDQSDRFSAFVHAPFRDDTEGQRNDTSFALQITLTDGETSGRALLLGDLSYPTLRRIFDISEDETLAWDVLLAPHHCSKSAMYWDDEEQTDAEPRTELLDAIEAAGGEDGYIIASSVPIPDTDVRSANPPHAKAAARYRERVADGHFLCTSEYPNEETPEPIIFELADSALVLRDAEGETTTQKDAGISPAVDAARGHEATTQTVGFGRA